MNVDSTKNVQTSSQTGTQKTSTTSKQTDVKFADELKNVNNKQKETASVKKEESTKDKNVEKEENKKSDSSKESNKTKEEKEDKNVNDAIEGLSDTLKEMGKLNHSEETTEEQLKSLKLNDDNNEENYMIDNDMNIREREMLSSQMNASMSFNSNGQPFSDFMNQDNKEGLSNSAKDIAEEKAIMSTMADNYMMAKARSNASEIQNTKNNTQQAENINSVVMTREDVDFFASLVNKQELNMNEITDVQKASHVSKTLADMLADSMKNNKPLRIDFDNDISVIIKISRDGKISADFLPSSQIAEAYLRDNLPILRQRFDENNIDYNELNQRRQRQEQEKDNKKKGSKNE